MVAAGNKAKLPRGPGQLKFLSFPVPSTLLEEFEADSDRTGVCRGT